jgi:hypothetical protein
MKTLLIAALMLAVPVFAQTKAPDTPAGQTVAGWIEAVNSGDRETMRAFHLAHSRGTDEDRQRADQHSAMDQTLYKRSGGVDLARVVKSTDTEIEVEVVSRGDGSTLVVGFKVSAAPPHVIEAGVVRPAGL